jgi:hypothetical protein
LGTGIVATAHGTIGLEYGQYVAFKTNIIGRSRWGIRVLALVFARSHGQNSDNQQKGSHALGVNAQFTEMATLFETADALLRGILML